MALTPEAVEGQHPPGLPLELPNGHIISLVSKLVELIPPEEIGTLHDLLSLGEAVVLEEIRLHGPSGEKIALIDKYLEPELLRVVLGLPEDQNQREAHKIVMERAAMRARSMNPDSRPTNSLI